ncbi:hypothetical protein E4634_13680 [Mangrovimicrobium sediminis]|uniref:Alkaline phosphatase n=1 Tax=Mangrovimicrobium sediminis TaxID=2562682 RepID=A0A4Z0LZ66_9GAMM|nr:alkaline phosphatase D family protein [Haliea sp. SAOS-164]TGD72571.1 hypothetical protein E4634_13680 [Haliea sp. SAOS-164]
MTLSRRHFLHRFGAVAAGSALLGRLPLASAEAIPFLHGIASGDPLHDRVILWTRVTPPPGDTRRVRVRYTVATDPLMLNVVGRGTALTGPERDYTVKVDAAGLQPGSSYYYRFEALGERSPVGRTRTLPLGELEQLRLAAVSCSNYPYGYFNVYRALAERADLDVVLHLGDYIYEYGAGTYSNPALGRSPLPEWEIVTLADYRARYSQYRMDADLQAAHRQHAFITVWDDHESANDAWRDGAQNHNTDKGEGEWSARKAAALQAYFEWMPIRVYPRLAAGRCWRSFRFGDLVDLVMLDTRLYGRDQQVATSDSAIDDPARSLLGFEQEDWFYGQLQRSAADGTRWRAVGQQVMFGQLQLEQAILNADQWDGYRANRARVLDVLEQGGIDDNVILTGDIHSSWGMEIGRDPYGGAAPLAVEFVTPGVTSPALEDQALADLASTVARRQNPHIKFADLFHRGYTLVDFTRERVQAEWYHAQTITEPGNSAHNLAAVLASPAGSNRLEAAAAASRPLREPAALA